MTDDEIVRKLRAGVPVAHIVRNGLGINPPHRPTLYRVRTLQAMYCPETRGKQGRHIITRRQIKGHRISLQVPDHWQWVEVSRETDSDGNVVSMKVEVSE